MVEDGDKLSFDQSRRSTAMVDRDRRKSRKVVYNSYNLAVGFADDIHDVTKPAVW